MDKINVFVTHDNGLDLSDSKRFCQGGGEVIPFVEGRRNIHKTDILQREILDTFKKMQPSDYLLIAGNAAICALVMSLVYSEFGRVKTLTWEYKDRCYVENLIDFDKFSK